MSGTAAVRKNVLVVDDEPHIVELLAMNLRQNGFDSCSAGDGPAAIAKAVTLRPDLIILDLMLPGMSGLETCRILRQDPRTARIPIIMLTAKSEESDKVIGLGIGADDYVTKPFGLRELIARIEVALRHAAAAGSAFAAGGTPYAAAEAEPRYGAGRVIRAAGLEIDETSHEARRGGERIALSPTEVSILAMLARKSGGVAARHEIESALGIASSGDEARPLDVHVRNLRRKLGARPGGGGYIGTVRGVGYRLDG